MSARLFATALTLLLASSTGLAAKKPVPDLGTLKFGPTATADAAVTVNASQVTNPSVNKRFMGCHHDYGFAQAPRFFTANLVYGSSFEPGTMRVPSWTTFQTAGSGGWVSIGGGSAFSSKPSTAVGLGSDAPQDAQAGVINRGIGGAGFALVGGQSYEFEAYFWPNALSMGFAELRDFTSNTSLARQEFKLVPTGPPWGSTWLRVNLTLTPSADTTCAGIAFGADPTIDCGNDAGPAHVCVRCGGELVVGLVGPSSSADVGFVSFMPGPWGRLTGPNGPLPVLKSAGDTLAAMGVTVIRSGGSVSQSMRWKDWRGPVWNRPSQQQYWGGSLLSGWGPFEVIDACNALGIEPIVTLAYDTNSALDYADLVEYCWGDPVKTAWGRQRAYDGHPQPFNITVFELGNEQYNPSWIDQVAAMEARAAEIGLEQPLYYMFPENGGLNADDAQRAVSLGLPIERIMPDLHVGAGGAVEAARTLFNQPPVPGFNQSAINCETNAGTHDLRRALDEASDLLDWFTADTVVTDRLYARTASFCSGASAQFDTWDQGIAFFLPNMTWFQPPGYVHVMITNTWADQTLASTFAYGNVPFAAQRTSDGTTLVLRAVNYDLSTASVDVTLVDAALVGPTYTLWTLSGPGLGADNTPSNPTAIAPVQSSPPVSSGSNAVTLQLAPLSFVVAVLRLQQ